MYKFSLDFRNTSCIISKNISSKVILKCHISMLTCLFRLSQNPFQSNKNCESCIRSIYQLEISKICIRFFFSIVTEHLLWNLSWLHKNDDWCRSVYVLALERYFIFVSFHLSLFFLFFVESFPCWGIELSFLILIIKQCSCFYSLVVPSFLSGISRSGLLQPLVINITGLV